MTDASDVVSPGGPHARRLATPLANLAAAAAGVAVAVVVISTGVYLFGILSDRLLFSPDFRAFFAVFSQVCTLGQLVLSVAAVALGVLSLRKGEPRRLFAGAAIGVGLVGLPELFTLISQFVR